jgi:hypothetical protein
MFDITIVEELNKFFYFNYQIDNHIDYFKFDVFFINFNFLFHYSHDSNLSIYFSNYSYRGQNHNFQNCVTLICLFFTFLLLI